ncbi:MAG TPA: sigma-70 family RNA polymerase sigma factor [Allosphingosinicella sp.]|nr:sigma-70 family RNA polymerase sigma factor [Allosphingosinicella sp.]
MRTKRHAPAELFFPAAKNRLAAGRLFGQDGVKNEGGKGKAGGSGAPDVLFATVVASHTGLISRIALAYEADPALRRELVQDIMLAIWAGLPRFRHESSLRTFVAGIAYKRSFSHVARAVRRPKASPLSDDLVSPEPLPDEIASRNQLKARMLEVVQTLPLGQKQAIILCLEEFSFAEIGKTMGIPTHAAQMRCQRAKAALRAAMETPS